MDFQPARPPLKINFVFDILSRIETADDVLRGEFGEFKGVLWRSLDFFF